MITATSLELRAGPRLLLAPATFRIAPGDRVGLVGRNGAGKTTLTKVLVGGDAGAGRAGDPVGRGRLSAPGPPHRRPRHARPRPHPVGQGPGHRAAPDARDRGGDGQRGPGHPRPRDATVRAARGESSRQRVAMPPRARQPSIASSLGLPERVLGQPLRTLSGGQRRRVELSRILFSGAESLLLDEPTNHLDADSIVWLRDYLRAYKGGLVVISHDVGLLDNTVNRVFHLDANRAELDIYNLGWKPYLQQRETDERRRKRERANVEKQASVAQGAGRPHALQGHEGAGGAEHGQAGGAAVVRAGGGATQRQGRQAALPRAGAVRQDTADRRRVVEVLRLARGLHRRRPGHRPWQPSRHPRAQRCRQDDAHAAARPGSRSRTPARSSRATA